MELRSWPRYAAGLALAEGVVRERAVGDDGSIRETAALLLRFAAALSSGRTPGVADLAAIRARLEPLAFRVRLSSDRNAEAAASPMLVFTVSDERTAAEPPDPDERLRRLLIEALIDLAVQASSRPAFRLRKCYHDGAWFEPPPIAPRSRFCSAACRTAHAERRRSLAPRFVCACCAASVEARDFSGVGRAPDGEGVAPTSYRDDGGLLCADCVLVAHTEWAAYAGVEHLALVGEPAVAVAAEPAVSEGVAGGHRRS